MTDPEVYLQSASAKHAIGRLLRHLSDLWLAYISVCKYAYYFKLFYAVVYGSFDMSLDRYFAIGVFSSYLRG